MTWKRDPLRSSPIKWLGYVGDRRGGLCGGATFRRQLAMARTTARRIGRGPLRAAAAKKAQPRWLKEEAAR